MIGFKISDTGTLRRILGILGNIGLYIIYAILSLILFVIILTLLQFSLQHFFISY